ncbi:peptide ABC transporter substrate-binding protein [Paenibacillus sediminis]|uniref:Oligopeptide transport system substrate-binding protein n=1 Tax=Paenibacillus sediminis TaxID=664909 RepID=A0ABS4GYT0_9BACL|nr:peptide ABC transporter substrate-binding protein [Paenibacillus sediminis]MBP1935438.1 oligopeptide transport system substrate-binding protein [Paenibacillus sediminis]
MKKKSMLALLTLLLIAGTVLAACGSVKKTASSGKSGEVAPAAEQVFRINFSSEPPTLDPGIAQDNAAITVLHAMYEGLTNVDSSGKSIPGVAETWDISQDGKTYTFHLRKDAKWSNGDPVTANDFVFAWDRALKPDLASPYAYQLYYVKNAQAYNEGKITDASQVGVKAVDDYTLEVQLENATPYFLNLTSFVTYFPVHKSVKDNEKWAADPSTMIVNGPFKLTNWTKGASLELVPNENYWDKKDIKLTKIQISIVNSGATELASYRSGQLDFAGKPVGEIPADQIDAVKKELPSELSIKGVATTYYYLFNVTAKPFDNVKIRRALTMAIDRQKLVSQVTKGGELPAFGFVPPGIIGEKQEFRTEHKDTDLLSENVDQAKQLLAEGLKEEGLTAFPKVTLTYNTGENHKKIAQAITDMWKTNLGIDVTLENQEWGVFLENRRNLNYQIARAGWGADYNDPMSFLDIFTSTSGNNDTGFKNAEYDSLVKQAYASNDAKTRMDAMNKAEQILIKDNNVIMPIYYYSNTALIKPYVKGVIIDYAGNIFFDRAYIEK